MKSISFVALAMLLAAACSDSGAPGTLEVRIYGEAFIEEGIPAAEFDDGWSIAFDTFLVSVGEVAVAAGPAGAFVIDDPAYRIYDLARPSGGSGFPVTSAEVIAGTYDHVRFRIAPSATAVAGNAEADDVEMMRAGGYAVWVAGVATRGGESKRFAWGFATATAYAACYTRARVDGDHAAIEITIHGDHIFYDDLVSSEPALSFDPMAAADRDGDDLVTVEELAGLDISAEERYQVGSLDIDDLWGFIDQQVSTVGHIDGEGHCDTTLRE